MAARRVAPGRLAPHGTRARYIAGCRCPECGEANRHYLDDYKAVRAIEGRQTVPAYAVAEHIAKLRASGVELTAIARLTGLSVHHLRAVARGEVPRVTRRLHDAVLSVQPGDYSENWLVPAAAAVELLDELNAAGIQSKTIAKAFGYRTEHLNIRCRKYVTQKTYRRLLLLAAAAGVRRQLDVLEVVA